MDQLGLDPELAVISRKTGLARSAHLFLGDTKEQFTFRIEPEDVDADPYDDEDYDDEEVIGSEVERDGAVVEVRSLAPTACRDNLIPYMAEAMRQTALKLNDWNGGRFKLSSAPAVKLDSVSLVDAPENVTEFGCNPDMDAYALSPKSPVLPKGDRWRYTGGHLHASTVPGARDVKVQSALAILYDYFIGLPMVGILGEQYRDGEVERRKFYGQPGSFRFDDAKHKIEYRTLSGRVMLHPTILAWAMGMLKVISAAYGEHSRWSSRDDSEQRLVALAKTMAQTVPPATIHEAIMLHDVETARRLTDALFPLLPNYTANDRDLENRMGGGGFGTTNPYFYHKAAQVFFAGNDEGLMWPDDLVENWGLYEHYKPRHHSYWGIQVAMVGLCDDDIFPFNAVLPRVMPENVLQRSPIYTHPRNGGAMEWVTRGAAAWLL